MLRSVSSRASSSSRAGVVAAALRGRLAGRRQHHVQADQLLNGAVVDRLGHAPADLGLRLDRPAREAARPQPAGRLGGAQAADDDAGGHRRRARRRSREGAHVAGHGRVAAHRRGDHQRHRAEQRDHDPAHLSLEVSVRGDQEQRRGSHGPVRVRSDELEDQQDQQVDGGTSGLSRSSGSRRASTRHRLPRARRARRPPRRPCRRRGNRAPRSRAAPRQRSRVARPRTQRSAERTRSEPAEHQVAGRGQASRQRHPHTVE